MTERNRVTVPERVAVVGGGAVGLCAAESLAERGVSVTLYERDGLGNGATGRAAGLCYDAYVDRTDARIAARSLSQFRELGVLTERPYLWVARSGDDHVAAAIREQAGIMRERGRDVELLDPTAVADRFPSVRTDHLAVGAVANDAGYVDTEAFVDVMADRVEQAGVDIRTDTSVSITDDGRLETDEGTERPDAVLVAAGAHTGRLLAEAGHSLAVGTYRAQALVTDGIGRNPPVFYDASERFYLRPRGDGVLVGDGAHRFEDDPDEADRTADADFLAASRARVETALGVTPVIRRSWAGICTATPDRDPLLGPVEDGLYVATGWHGHGFMRAPGLGRMVADQILGGDGIAHFDPRRFDGDEGIALPDGIVE